MWAQLNATRLATFHFLNEGWRWVLLLPCLYFSGSAGSLKPAGMFLGYGEWGELARM
jgi:hypothetical protein